MKGALKRFTKFIAENCLFIATAIFPVAAFCQNINTDTTTSVKDTTAAIRNDSIRKKDSVAQIDLVDVIRTGFGKHAAAPDKPVVVSTKPVITVVPAVGYTLQTKLAAVISGNVAFRMSKNSKLSAVTASASYTENKQFFVPVQSNIYTKGNRFKLVGDHRFYKYPQSTFGLGSNTHQWNEDPMSYLYFRFYEIALKQIKGNFFAGAGYNLDYHWKISHKGTRGGEPSDYAKYGMARSTISSGITLNGIYDSRNNPINSSRGAYGAVQFRNNFKALGSDHNWNSLLLEARKYFQLPGRSKNVLALWSYNVLILNGKPPYLDLPSTAWDNYNNTGRGYIQGRFRGSKMVYFESEYRLRITRNGLFGAVVFANEQAFARERGTALEKFQTGYGGGLRVKLNKDSNTNLSLDYAFGAEGSRGLFIAVGEVF
jgi:hypothetical protein